MIKFNPSWVAPMSLERRLKGWLRMWVVTLTYPWNIITKEKTA